MGQWVDLDILHKFYPINKSKEELRAYLLELERGNFLKLTDTEGVWECNMVCGGGPPGACKRGEQQAQQVNVSQPVPKISPAWRAGLLLPSMRGSFGSMPLTSASL